MKLLMENWRRHLKESSKAELIDKVHTRATELGVLWNNNRKFMRRTKTLTGKSHLDDMTNKELEKVYKALEGWSKEDK